MKILLVGVGGVGEAIAVTAKSRLWLEKLVLADYNLARAQEVQQKIGEGERFPVEQVDASDMKQVIEIARKYKVDLLMNSVNVDFTYPLFDASFEYGCIYGYGDDWSRSGYGPATACQP